jgi:hypothetical protein
MGIRRSVSKWTPTSRAFLTIVVLLLSLLVLSYSLHRWFDHDEFEHIHAAWYIAEGYTPYSDFFQNHNPLLWYCMAPVLPLLGYSTQTVLILRVAMFALTMGIAFLTFLIARRASLSTTASLLSVVLLLSMVMFLEKSIEIRPDVPQVLLGLVSVYFFVSYIQTHDNRNMVLAGVSAALSFLFLQKTIFLLIAYSGLLLYGLSRRRISRRWVLYFLVALSMPMLLFLGYLVLSGSLSDYLLTNWVVNSRWLETLSPLYYLSESFVTENALFWLLAPASIGFVLLSPRTSSALKATTFVGVVLLSSLLLVRVPFRQYYMMAIVLLCVATGYLLERVVVRFGLRGIHTLILVIVLLSQPLLSLAPASVTSGIKNWQLARVDFVLRNSADSDLMYDGNIQFNLYRPDLHYFWFSVGENKGLDTYRAITKDVHGDYDGCQLVKSKRPRFISDYELDITACGLRALYDQTRYDGLYVLREVEGVEHPLWRDFGGVAALLGYAVQAVTAGGEDRLQMNLWWRALAEMDRDYTVFIHIVDQDGGIRAQQDTLLLSGDRPTSAWRAGETVKQQYDLALPSDATRAYTVLTGLYCLETGERLPVWDEAGQRVADDAIPLLPEPQEHEPE